jgi:hypothetical protein
MKHSKKERKPKGYSRGRNDDNIIRTGPIMVEDIMNGEDVHSRSDMSIREMVYRTDPTNASSPIIKLKFKPLDNPKQLLTVLQGILVIKQGIVGNNVTTGPLQYQYWRGCLTGTALARFNTFAREHANETVANLLSVEHKLVDNFAPRDVLRQQHRYMRLHMRKPRNVSTRQYVGAVASLNETLTKMPPDFDDDQKLAEKDILDIMASKAPQSHKDLLTEHGFIAQTSTVDQFVEFCERAEAKEAKRKPTSESDYEDSDRERQQKKAKKKPKPRVRTEFYCKEHGPNHSHNSKDCKILLDPKGENGKKKSNNPDRYKDYKSKYQKKHAELNLLQHEAKKEKAKYAKAYKQLKGSSDSESSEAEASKKRSDSSVRNTAQNGTEVYNVECSSSSSSSSDSDSE